MANSVRQLPNPLQNTYQWPDVFQNQFTGELYPVADVAGPPPDGRIRENASLKDTFADLGRGFFRLFGREKLTVLLGFTVTSYNLDRIRNCRTKERAQHLGVPTAFGRRGTRNNIT